MSDNFILIVSIFLAALPAIVWSYIFFDDPKDKNRSLYFKVFLGGTLTVLPILGLQAAYFKMIEWDPNLDFVFSIKQAIGDNWWIIATYAFVGITEEIVKFYIIRYSDKNHPELITTINRSLKFGILSALGFAFSENILYFSRIWQAYDLQGLIAPFIFRSTFTVCAHLCFAGLFGYFYGISKFSKDFIDFKKWKGEKIAVNEYQKFRNRNIAIGLILSTVFHAAFNIILELGNIIKPITINIGEKEIAVNVFIILVVLQVALMFMLLQYLLNRKTGSLTFVLADKHRSTMSIKDEEVVLELIGMWYNQGRYEEVNGICERLLKRDPDNNVVKLFKAKVQDQLSA